MLDRYRAASKAGFRGVEVAFPYEYPAAEIAVRLRDNNLTLVQILSPFDWDGGERGIAALPDRVADFRRSIETAIAYAVQVGKPMIHVMTGNVLAGLEWGQSWETFPVATSPGPVRFTLPNSSSASKRSVGRAGSAVNTHPPGTPWTP